MIYAVIAAVVAYLIGSINSSILISKAVSGKDIRESGSGNAGATNMLRTMGKKYAVITLILDILKGVVAILLSRLMIHLFNAPDYIVFIAGLFVAVGHCYPVFFGFKGGKAVATGLGVLLMWDWQTGLIVLAAAILIMALTRYVSLGSIMAAVLFAVIECIKSDSTVGRVCFIILAALLVFKHRANIVRLVQGKENKLGAKKNG